MVPHFAFAPQNFIELELQRQKHHLLLKKSLLFFLHTGIIKVCISNYEMNNKHIEHYIAIYEII